MKRYCMINKIKEEYLQDYADAHMNPWRELLESLKEAGTNQELIYMYSNMAIIFIECEDMDLYMKKFAESETGRKWLEKMSVYLEESEFADDEGKPKGNPAGLRKVFDLNQQLAGNFTQF